MKKLTAFLFVLTGIALVFALYSCAGGESFSPVQYSSGETPVTGVSIDVTDRAIRLTASPDRQVRFASFACASEYYDISVSDAGELRVELRIDKNWTDYFGAKQPAKYRVVQLEIPSGLLDSVSLKTTGEPVSISPLAVAERLSVESNGGDVTFDRLTVGKRLAVSAKNGNITGSLTGSWDDFSITVQIKKGESNLPLSKPDGAKSLAVSSNNGDVRINFVKA